MKQRGLPSFQSNVQYFGANASFNTSLIPFMSSLSKFLRPNDVILQICLSRINRNILQILTQLFLYNAILTCFRKSMPKASALKTFFETKRFIIYNFQYSSHCIEIWPLIFDINNDLFLKPYLFNNFIKLLANAWLVVSITSKKAIITCFGCQSLPKKLITNAKTS